MAAALQQVNAIAIPLGTTVVALALTAIKQQLAPYPGQPDRDRANPGGKHPSPYNTYVRGVGRFPRSAFKKIKKGQKAGQWRHLSQGKVEKAGGKVSMTSEQLDQSWKTNVHTGPDAVFGELRNTASYSGYVLGHKGGAPGGDDIPPQVGFHAQTGWANIDDALVAAQPTIDAAFNQAIDQIMTYLTNA